MSGRLRANLRAGLGLLVALSLCTSGCRRPPERKACDEPQGRFGFFELRTFVCKLADSLEASGTPARRTVAYGEVSVADTSSPTWATILTPFANLDLNVEAGPKNYRTTRQGNAVTYQYVGGKVRETLPVQSMTVNYGPDSAVQSITINTIQRNLLYTHKRKLSLERGGPGGRVMVTVGGLESVVLSGTRVYKIQFEGLPK